MRPALFIIFKRANSRKVHTSVFMSLSMILEHGIMTHDFK